MEISEGMYVRFKDKRGSHYIRKITSVNTECPGKLYAGIYIDKTANNCNGVSLKNIINASHRLIDLIDKGDYVNGYKVLWVYNTEIAKSGPLYVVIDNHDDVVLRNKIISAIGRGSWNSEDITYKPICDELRELGFEIIGGKDE